MFCAFSSFDVLRFLVTLQISNCGILSGRDLAAATLKLIWWMNKTVRLSKLSHQLSTPFYVQTLLDFSGEEINRVWRQHIVSLVSNTVFETRRRQA